MSTETKKSGAGDKKKATRVVNGKLTGPKGGTKPKKPLILFALIKMSGIGITEISGKLGGNVFSRTKGGAVIRNRVVPTNPQTVAQQQVRAIFGAISSAWRSLTELQRNAWNSIAEDYPYQNKLGETKILSGKALFQKLNDNLLFAGESILELPQPPQGTNAPIAISTFDVENFVGGADLDSLLVEGNLAKAGDNTSIVVVEMTPALSPGVKNAAPRFVRVAQQVASASAFSFGIGFEYKDIFGVPSTGSQVQCRVFTVNPVTGEKSATLGETTIVVEV